MSKKDLGRRIFNNNEFCSYRCPFMRSENYCALHGEPIEIKFTGDPYDPTKNYIRVPECLADLNPDSSAKILKEILITLKRIDDKIK